MEGQGWDLVASVVGPQEPIRRAQSLLKSKRLSITNTTSAAHGGSHECPGRPRRCSVREHVPRAPSLGPPLGWAPLRAQSSPPRLSCSNSLRHAEELVTELRRALVDLHGSKSVLAFARDEFYIGPIYGVTGPKVRPSQRRRHRRCEGAIRRALCGESALPCSRPAEMSYLPFRTQPPLKLAGPARGWSPQCWVSTFVGSSPVVRG